MKTFKEYLTEEKLLKEAPAGMKNMMLNLLVKIHTQVQMISLKISIKRLHI